MTKIFLLVLFSIFNVCSFAQNEQIDATLNVTDKETHLRELDSITQVMIRNNDVNQEKYLRDYLDVAIDLEEYDKAALKSRYLIQHYIFENKNDKATRLLNEMLSFKSFFKNSNSEGHLFLKKGAIDFRENDLKNAVKAYEQSIPLLLKSNDSIYVADAHYFSAQAYSEQGDFINAFTSFEKAKNLYSLLGDDEYALNVEYESIILLHASGLKDISNTRKKELLAQIKDKDDYIFTALVSFSLVHDEQRVSPEKSYENEFMDIENLIKKIKHPFYINKFSYSLNGLKFSDALYKNNLDQAKIHFEQMMNIENKLNDDYNKILFLDTKVKYYQKTNDFEKAKALLDEFFKKYKNVENGNVRLEIEKAASELYENQGNNELAQQHSKAYIKIRDSIYNATAANSYAYHQAKLETNEKDQEITKQDGEIQQLEIDKQLAVDKRKIYILAFSLVLILLGGLSYYFLNMAKRKNKNVSKQLAQSEQELIDFTKSILAKINEHEQLEKEYDLLKNSHGEKEELEKLHDLSNARLLTNDDWDVFKTKFHKVYPRFFVNFKNKGFKFSSAEERLISLEKLSLKTDEIANMLGISSDSVHTARYRLRKKINIPKDIDIIEFLKL